MKKFLFRGHQTAIPWYWFFYNIHTASTSNRNFVSENIHIHHIHPTGSNRRPLIINRNFKMTWRLFTFHIGVIALFTVYTFRNFVDQTNLWRGHQISIQIWRTIKACTVFCICTLDTLSNIQTFLLTALPTSLTIGICLLYTSDAADD